MDWENWTTALEQFAAATGIVVSAYDSSGTRRVGPILASRISVLLNESTLWHDAGLGTQLEQRLAARCIETGEDQTDGFCNELCVHATPVIRYGTACGTVVFGWNFKTFATGQGCSRIASTLDIPVAKFWGLARLEVPVPDARMAIYTGLLRTMIDFAASQAEAIDRLNELSRMREVFLASVSHEMRTPLAAIALRLDMLLMGTLDNPDAIRSALQSMANNVAQEEKLIEDLIDAARTRTGQLQIVPAHVSLRHILEEAMATIEPKARFKQVALGMSVSDNLDDAPVWGDSQRLQQLFWNILSNAVKFTPAGGNVNVKLHPGPKLHRVDLQDTGRGIDAKDLPHIFEAFNKQQSDNEQGLGLGLSIAKHIADLHGGRIQASSEGLGKGTMFTVFLPCYREHDSSSA